MERGGLAVVVVEVVTFLNTCHMLAGIVGFFVESGGAGFVVNCVHIQI